MYIWEESSEGNAQLVQGSWGMTVPGFRGTVRRAVGLEQHEEGRGGGGKGVKGASHAGPWELWGELGLSPTMQVGALEGLYSVLSVSSGGCAGGQAVWGKGRRGGKAWPGSRGLHWFRQAMLGAGLVEGKKRPFFGVSGGFCDPEKGQLG